eukprot:TRINITY_DN20_c0_g1_i1.p1 TRINITY_DN20_c0_g1~~TRINITY_DN20_c0_g1_i1.p1  ORF type:complete len:270 (+),score=60.73 TRINITY_DN20_c0_g1_i1:59-868(+)
MTEIEPLEKILLNPLELLDSLAPMSAEQKGNTPRPQKSEMLFVNGMKFVQHKKYDEAFKKLMEAVKEGEKDVATEGGDEKKKKEGLAVSLCGLGFLCATKNELQKAEVCYVRALGIWQAILGKGNSKLMRLYVDIGQIFEREAKYEKASKYYEKARKLLIKTKKGKGESTAVEDDPEVLSLACAVANVLVLEKKFEEAEKSFSHSITALKSANHPFELQARKLYTHLLKAQNRDADAKTNDARIKELEEKFSAKEVEEKLKNTNISEQK